MKIFLAGPYTGKLEPETGLINSEYRRMLEDIIVFLETKGHIVFNAHKREKWGAAIEPPETAIVNDFVALKESQMIIAHLSTPLSPGVQWELGVAASFGIKTVLLKESNAENAYLLDGMHKLTETYQIAFNDLEELLGELEKVI
jgi:hypothetical protein